MGSNASGGRIVLLPSAFWAPGASKMATLGASLLRLYFSVFQSLAGHTSARRACRTSRASARRIVSCRGFSLLRKPGRFTTRPLPVHFTTRMSVVRPFSVLSKDEIGP